MDILLCFKIKTMSLRKNLKDLSTRKIRSSKFYDRGHPRSKGTEPLFKKDLQVQQSKQSDLLNLVTKLRRSLLKDLHLKAWQAHTGASQQVLSRPWRLQDLNISHQHQGLSRVTTRLKTHQHGNLRKRMEYRLDSRLRWGWVNSSKIITLCFGSQGLGKHTVGHKLISKIIWGQVAMPT